MSRQSKPVEGTSKDTLSHELMRRGGMTNNKAMAVVVGKKTYGPKRAANWAAKQRAK